MSETVHRLDAITLLVDLGEIHIFAIVIEMARCFPKLCTQNLRAHNEIVTTLNMLALFKFFEYISQHGTFGVPKHHAGANLIAEGKEIQFAAKLTMVTPFRLFDTM